MPAQAFLASTIKRFAMTAFVRHRPASTPPPQANCPRHSHYGLLALLAACLAIAGTVLPIVWDLLGSLKQLPKIAWLESTLARSPALSWSLMLAWGTAVSAALLATLSMRKGWQGLLLVAGLSLGAVIWYMHMPGTKQCQALYGVGAVCNIWQWVFSISLALATALYMFGIFLLGLSALGLLFTRPDETSDETSEE